MADIEVTEELRESLRCASGRTLSQVVNAGAISYKMDPEPGENHRQDFFDICCFVLVKKPKASAGSILADRAKRIKPDEDRLKKSDILDIQKAAWEFIEYSRLLDAPDIPEEYRSLVNVSEDGSISIDYQAVAKYLLNTFHCVSYVGGGDGDGLDVSSQSSADLYVYDPDTGIYSRDASALKAKITEICNGVGYPGSITTITREILHYVAYEDPQRIYPFNLGEDRMPVLNGLLELHYDGTPHELIPHSPENRYTYYLPVKYDPEADPAPIHAILSQYVKEEDDIDFLYQIVAQSILQGFCDVSPYKTAYLIQGLPHGGKSTYHDLLVKHFFSLQFVSKESLQDLCGGNRFSTSSLPDKFMNCYDDLDDMGGLKNVGDFNNLVGSFNHAVEAKLCRRKTEKVSCVHLFTCNRPPLLENKRLRTNRAWWERWVYIKFNNSGFEIDPNFQKKNFTPENLSGFLNRVLEYMVRIRNDPGAFKRMSPDEVLDNWSTTADPIRAYVADCFYEVRGGTLTKYDKTRMLESYKEYCQVMGIDDVHGIETVEKLSRRLFEEGFQQGRGKNLERVYQAPLAWQGLREGGVKLLTIDPTHKDARVNTLDI